MRLITSNITTENLKVYFKGYLDGSKWNTHINDGMFFAWCDLFSVTVIPEAVTYNVQISDIEDPSDSDEGTTDNPAEFIAEFMSTGTPGDEFWEKRSSISPTNLRDMMLRLSNGLDNQAIKPKHLVRALRRSIVAMDLDGMRRMITAAVKLYSSNFETEEASKIRSEMEKKGWKVRIESSKSGLPRIVVDIGELYEAIITIDDQLWNCKFEVNNTDIKDNTITNDPIVAFTDFRDKYYKTPQPPQPTTQRVLRKK